MAWTSGAHIDRVSSFSGSWGYDSISVSCYSILMALELLGVEERASVLGQETQRETHDFVVVDSVQ